MGTRISLGLCLALLVLLGACSDDSETTTASGAGANASCSSCNDYFVDPMNVAITDVCGVTAYNPPMAGQGGTAMIDLTCTAGTSCDLLKAMLECACGSASGCPDADECGPNVCKGEQLNQTCKLCLGQVCVMARDACTADAG